jgi:hypothetical protein
MLAAEIDQSYYRYSLKSISQVSRGNRSIIFVATQLDQLGYRGKNSAVYCGSKIFSNNIRFDLKADLDSDLTFLEEKIPTQNCNFLLKKIQFHLCVLVILYQIVLYHFRPY